MTSITPHDPQNGIASPAGNTPESGSSRPPEGFTRRAITVAAGAVALGITAAAWIVRPRIGWGKNGKTNGTGSTGSGSTNPNEKPGIGNGPDAGLAAKHRNLPEGVRVYRDVPYVKNGAPLQKLDLYVNPTPSAPLVIWVHGGGWHSGSKEWLPLRFLLGHGFSVASVDYRLSDTCVFPAPVQDCKAAIRFLRASAEQFGLSALRIGITGDAAGGHLVTLIGTSGGVLDFDQGDHLHYSSRVQAVCAIGGPTNLGLYGFSKPGDPFTKFLGGRIQDSPAVIEAANPITYVTRDDPPFLLVHGSKDEVVPVTHSEALAHALREAGCNVTLKIIDGAAHSIPASQLEDTLVAFFRKTLLGT